MASEADGQIAKQNHANPMWDSTALTDTDSYMKVHNPFGLASKHETVLLPCNFSHRCGYARRASAGGNPISLIHPGDSRQHKRTAYRTYYGD